MDSQKLVKALVEVDPGFVALCKTLFGDVVEPGAVWQFMYSPDGLALMPVAKAMPDQADVSAPAGRLVRRSHVAADAVADRPKVMVRNSRGTYTTLAFKDNDARTKWLKDSYAGKTPGVSVRKEDGLDVTWEAEFSKVDTDKRQVFGWASVVEVDGRPVVDRQGDWITPDEIEKAAYNYVVANRLGGHQHRRGEDGAPFKASDLIESFVVTPEKISKMGLPEDTPVGWWVGYKVHDDEAWEKVKKGEVTGFSIHGRGKRQEVEVTM